MKHGGIKEILETRQFPGVTGTRDSFGVRKEFYDPQSGQYINNWKSWEKAGFRSVDTIKNDYVKKQAKQKMKRCKSRGDRQVDPSVLPT